MFKIAVVGCGGISNAWLSVVSKRTDTQIVALVDFNQEVALIQKEKYQLNSSIYKNLEDALESETIDIVFDLTPPEFHYKTVTTALTAGCHVFGEKPMSDTLENAYKMIECSDKTQKEYFVMQNRRYLKQLYAMKNFLQSGQLGGIGQLSADFQLNPHFGGFRDEMESPLIADMSIHTFDAARYLLGKNPVSVYCHEFNPAWSWYKGDASAVCIFEMEDGTVFDYRGSWCSNGINTSWESQWRAACSDGGVFWDGADTLFYEKDSERKDISLSVVPEKKALLMEMGGHAACIEEMFSALKSGARPQTDCRDNIKSIEMVYKAIESSRTKKKIHL